MKQNFTIRPFDYSDFDYEAAVKLMNQIWPDDPSTVETWKEGDKGHDPDDFKLRFIGEIKQENTTQIVAVASINEWSKRPGKFSLDLDIDPAFEGQGFDEALYNHLVKVVEDKNPVKLKMWIREDKTHRIELFQQKGFKESLRSLNSELDLLSFEFAPFAKYVDKATAAGIEIISLEELQTRDSDWMQKLYDLEMTIASGIRYAEAFTPMGLEEFAKEFKQTNFRADAWFIALDGNDYVGTCSIYTEEVLEDKLSQSFTGVLPSHRRRGIGTAIKLKSIAFAKAIGAKVLETSNEENNPMYTLNIKLGFKPAPAWLHFQKFCKEPAT